MSDAAPSELSELPDEHSEQHETQPQQPEHEREHGHGHGHQLPTHQLTPQELEDRANPPYHLVDTTLNINRGLQMAGISATKEKVAGYAYVILQVIRFCNVFVLVSVMAASVLMLAFAKLPDAYQLFSDIIHVAVFFFAAILIFTEVGLWERGQAWVASAWPMLGEDRGFSGLGLVMLLIGCHLLASLSDNIYFADGVPSQIPQVILGAGIISLVFGFTNIIASFAFRGEHWKARVIRTYGASVKPFAFPGKPNGGRANISDPIPHYGGAYGSDLEKGGRMEDEETSVDQMSVRSEYYGHEDKSDYSRRSPIVPDIQRPPTALHPMHRPASISYSVASHITRGMGNAL